MYGARVTDAVSFFHRRGEVRGAVRILRNRVPERFRWRNAVANMTAAAGQLRGTDRMLIEEPIREIVLDMDDLDLRREVVLDARRNRVDLDRGEVLPRRTLLEMRRLAFMTRADVGLVARYVKLPEDLSAPIDTAAVVLVGRALADAHRRRAQRLWLEMPDADAEEPMRLHHRYMANRAEHDAKLASRWSTFAQELVRIEDEPIIELATMKKTASAG